MAIPPFTPRRQPPQPGPKVVSNANWITLCQRSNKRPLDNLFNVLLALRNDPEWVGRFRYDEMAHAVVMPVGPVQDDDLYRIHEWMQSNGLRRTSLDTVREAVEIVSREHRFHPLRDWLDSLVWDKSFRLIYWLRDCLGCDDTDYHANVGSWFLISMVARIYRPGCQADHMLVLEGPQGILKSQTCRAIAGEYFSDALPDLTSDYVRVSMHLRGKWLIEVAELSAFSRAESTKLKSFLTQQVEDFIPKFGRNETHEPRQCVFIGTTNKDTYLRDETGGRRFWPVKCGTIDLNQLRADREQLFAEAVEMFRRGEPWFPDHAFWDQHIRPLQAQRYIGDAWEALLTDWDGTDAARDSNGRPIYEAANNGEDRTPAPRVAVKGPPYYLIDLARGALHLDRLSKAEEMRLAATLDHLGWTRAKRTNRGIPWVPPTP